MDHRLIEGLMEVVVPAVRGYVDSTLTKATAPLLAEIEELKARKPEKGEPGQSVTVEDLRPLIEAEVATLPPAEPGKSITPDDVRPMLEELVAFLPKPENGKDADPELIELMVSEAVAKLPPAEPGKSVDPEEVAVLVSTQVEKAVAALPKPVDGKDVDLADVRLIVAEEVAKIPPPTNGKDGAPGDIAFAPDDLVDHVAAAVRLLHEAPAIQVNAGVDVLPVTAMGLRSFEFDRDAKGRVVAAHEVEDAQ